MFPAFLLSQGSTGRAYATLGIPATAKNIRVTLPMTRILVLHYSQTGQLTRAVQSMLSPLAGRADVQIVWQNLEPVQAFPFPWGFLRFFDTFPECVHLDAPPIRPVAFAPEARFDLEIGRAHV